MLYQVDCRMTANTCQLNIKFETIPHITYPWKGGSMGEYCLEGCREGLPGGFHKQFTGTPYAREYTYTVLFILDTLGQIKVER